MKSNSLRRWALSCCCIVLWGGLFWPSETSAQETVEASEAQQTLNDEGVRALIEGDYAGAVALLERSSRLGELNVTFLNLGRAYQKLGRCDKAREALEKAKTAPAIADPPADEIRAVASRFLAELAESCDEVEPPPETAESGDPPDEPSDEPSGEPSDEPDEAAEVSSEAQDASAPSSVPEESSSSTALAWGATLSGVALIGGGVALHFVAESERSRVVDASLDSQGRVDTLTQAEAIEIEQSADRLDTIGLAAGITGAVVSGIGVYLFMSRDNSTDGGVSLRVSPDNLGVVWSQRF